MDAGRGPRSWSRRPWSLLDLFGRLGSRPYDWMYARGAPWESGPRAELVELVETGRISPDEPGPSALDVGCGSGSDSLFLAGRGFDVVGFDFSRVAIEKAKAAAADAERAPRFLQADIFNLPLDVGGPFDLLFDGGTVDDFPPRRRPEVARILTDLSRPGSIMVMWCFQSTPEDTPWLSFGGGSRLGAPPVYPGEEVELFGRWWDIGSAPVTTPPGAACFLMTRR